MSDPSDSLAAGSHPIPPHAEDDALACLEKAEANPHTFEVWPPLLYALSVGPQPSDLWAALALMGRCGQDRIAGLEALGRQLGEQRRGDALERLSMTTAPQNEAPYFASVLWTLLARYRYRIDYDLDAACALYDRALTGFPFERFLQDLPPAEQQSMLRILGHYTVPPLISLDPPEYIGDAPPEDPQRMLTPWPALPAADLLVLAACDDRYLQMYGHQFLQSVFTALPTASVLIHVMNPSDASAESRRHWQKEFPRCGFSEESGPTDVSYYAARRFMIADMVRRHYHRDLLILDIDEVMTPAFPAVLERARQAPLALWFGPEFLNATNGILEGIVYAAGDNPLAGTALAATAAWLRKRHAENRAFWHWDGYALHHGLSHLGPQRAEVLDLAPLYPRLPHDDGELPQKTVHKRLDSTDDQPNLQRLVAQAFLRRFDPQHTPQPFQMAGLSPALLAELSVEKAP